MVPFSFSQPHCTSSALIRMENCIVPGPPPTLGQLQGWYPHLCSHLPYSAQTPKPPISKRVLSWERSDDKVREVDGQTIHSPAGTSETLCSVKLSSTTPLPPSVHMAPQRPTYQRFVSDQESLGQRKSVGLKHYTIPLQQPSLLRFFIANVK